MPKVDVLGDPHLGRQFIHGVPLDRRGEREQSVLADFNRSLQAEADYHICLGDLFDKPVVSYGLIVETAISYAKAAQQNPDTTYVVIKGNHDWLRDLEQPSAFDVFCLLVGDIPNILVVTEWFTTGGMTFFAWHPTISAADMVRKAQPERVVYGHWDTEFGDLNMIPTKELADAGVKTAITGHVHKADQFTRDGVDVIVHGSMQPYAHGEESDDSLYVTLTLDELQGKDLHNKCVRVLLGPDEILDQEVDCLQLTVKKETADTEDAPTVSLGEFDMESLFNQVFDEEKVPIEIRDALLGKFHEKRLVDGA